MQGCNRPGLFSVAAGIRFRREFTVMARERLDDDPLPSLCSVAHQNV
ncbi:hypothetical protein SAMN02745824_2785 [Parasphingorhabdus marina DSM 22363]|uniref:Uncharacterized protein n=1 Tax=Parasphingorhabdus marina DSM 22363 TaxID=1123272 RepID=A0A1N6GDV4_9SPHN|nr:hypothetical protein SAMN02745824_2785 [Parasphingorhabdus marina DSM 22363]